MTPIQTQTVNTLKSEGFQVVEINRDIVRLTKGADARLVRRDGSQKRAQHVVVGSNVTVIRGCV
jgi:hypothetical protein